MLPRDTKNDQPPLEKQKLIARLQTYTTPSTDVNTHIHTHTHTILYPPDPVEINQHQFNPICTKSLCTQSHTHDQENARGWTDITHTPKECHIVQKQATSA